MTKLFSIVFSSLILFQSFNIGFDDISKFEILLEHATFHQETYGDSFIEFITEHYGEEFQAVSNEHEEHEDLPFKQDHQTSHHTPTIFMVSALGFEIKNQLFTLTSKHFFYKETYSFLEKPSVFQPPKHA